MAGVKHNTAHSCRVGFNYVRAASEKCNRVSNIFAHHTTEVGVVYNRIGLSMEVEHVLLSDNRHGMALLPVGQETLISASIQIRNSAVIGASDNGGAYAKPARAIQTLAPRPWNEHSRARMAPTRVWS
jgi:hypothetical protein